MKDRRPPYPPNMTPAPSGGMDPSEALAQRVALMRTQMAQSNQSPSSVQVAQAQAAGQGPSAQSRQPQRALPMPPSNANAELAIASRNLQQPQNRYIPGIQQKLREREFIAASQQAQEERAAMEMQERDARYKNAWAVLSQRDDISSEEKDGIARLFAAGDIESNALFKKELDLNDVLNQRNKFYDDAKQDIDFYKKSGAEVRKFNNLAKGIDLNKNNAAAQVGMLYSFIRGLDPESVVRTGEVELTEAAQSFWTRIKNMSGKLSNDQIYDADFVSQLVNLTGQLAEINRLESTKALQYHISRIESNGFRPEKVFGPMLSDEINEILSDGAGVYLANNPDAISVEALEQAGNRSPKQEDPTPDQPQSTGISDEDNSAIQEIFRKYPELNGG